MPPPPDHTLVAAARAGNRDAFATLVERHRGALLRTCRRALGDPAGARLREVRVVRSAEELKARMAARDSA